MVEVVRSRDEESLKEVRVEAEKERREVRKSINIMFRDVASS